MSNALTNALKLAFQVAATDSAFGAKGDSTTDNATALQAWIDSLSIGTVYGEARQRRGYLPTGVYLYNGNLTISDSVIIEGDGEINSILLCGATTGDALTIAATQFEISGIGIYATSARQAGTGRGIVIDAGLGTTSARGTLRNVHVLGAPSDGIEAIRVEHHRFERVWASYCGGRGIYINHGAGAASWNTLDNCRSQFCDGIGIELSSNCQHNTLINPEAIAFGGTAGMKIAGRGNVLINPDCENFTNITGATTFIGLHLLGTRHHVIRGYFGDLNRPIFMEGAAFCTIDHPTLTNGFTGVTAAIGIEMDSACTRNTLNLPGSATSVTALLSPSTGRDGDTINIDGMRISGAVASRPVAVAGGASYTPDIYYQSDYVITLDQNFTLNAPTNRRTNQQTRFRFIQGGAGGYTVTLDSAYHHAWSDTGNTVGKQSTISFVYAGAGVHIQDGAQSPYV